MVFQPLVFPSERAAEAPQAEAEREISDRFAEHCTLRHLPQPTLPVLRQRRDADALKHRASGFALFRQRRLNDFLIRRGGAADQFAQAA